MSMLPSHLEHANAKADISGLNLTGSMRASKIFGLGKDKSCNFGIVICKIKLEAKDKTLYMSKVTERIELLT